MARCLRCKAGNEWIEGDVKDEPRALVDELKAIQALMAQAWEKEKGGAFTPLSAALTMIGKLIATSDRCVPPK